ncbi:splicing factor SF3a60 [Tanacetum coccineum]
MSSTLLELTRSAHEDTERFERLIVKDLQNEPASSKDRLAQSHRVRHLIDQITSTTHKLAGVKRLYAVDVLNGYRYSELGLTVSTQGLILMVWISYEQYSELGLTVSTQGLDEPEEAD